jgi:hypothetical protein
MSWEATVLGLLSASLLRPLLLAAAAVLVLWVFRVEHPASKHAIWTVVLIGMVIVQIAEKATFLSLFAGLSMPRQL